MTDTETTGTDLDRLPSRLSPSRAKDYLNCPQAFYYKTIERLPTKNTPINTRGTIAHDALEELFKLPKEERTVDRAVGFVVPAWKAMKKQDRYKDVVVDGSKEEQDMIDYATMCVRNYFTIEDPTVFDPVGLEKHVEATVSGVVLHGYIDRLDRMPVRSEGGKEKYFVEDYKTGKHPNQKYVDDAFFAMRIYALLVYEQTGEMPHMIRLLYIKGTGQEAVERELVTEKTIERARREVDQIWTKIKASAASGNWPTKTGPLCNFCDFKDICPAWKKD